MAAARYACAEESKCRQCGACRCTKPEVFCAGRQVSALTPDCLKKEHQREVVDGRDEHDQHGVKLNRHQRSADPRICRLAASSGCDAPEDRQHEESCGYEDEHKMMLRLAGVARCVPPS